MKIKDNITRIIGIILLGIGIIAFKYLGGSSLGFFIPGLIMLIANTKIAQKEFKQFLQTFKPVLKKKYFVIALYDMFSWFGLFMITAGLGSMMSKKLFNLVPGPSIILSLISMLLTYFAALIILSIIIYSIFKGLIWLTILNKKIEWQYFTKVSILNLAWFAVWLIPVLVLTLEMKPAYFFYGLILGITAFIHLTTVAHYHFTKKQLIWFAIKNAFITGIGKIKKFLLPYSYMTLVYLVVIQLFWLVPRTQKYMLFAGLLIIVFYMAWYRLYMNKILEKIT